MKIFIRTIFATFFLAQVHSSFACTKNNHIRPFDVISDDVRIMFEKREFRKLQTLEEEYESKRSKTFDGYSALMAFYQGIAYGFDNCARRGEKTEKEWAEHHELLKEWVNALPNSVVPKLALAFFMTDYAWHARGSGYANTVSEQAWTTFKERIASSREQLEAVTDRCRNNPAWYNGMLSVALAQGWKREKFETLYRKGTKLDPYYVGLHYSRVNYLTAKWYGSDEEAKKAIDEATRMTRGRLGESLYTRLHWTYFDTTGMFKNGVISWPRMKRGFEDALHTYPDKVTRNAFARFACRAEDVGTLKQQLDQLGDQASSDLWTSPENFAYCKAYARSTPNGKPITCFKRDDTGEVICD